MADYFVTLWVEDVESDDPDEVHDLFAGLTITNADGDDIGHVFRVEAVSRKEVD